VDRPAIERALAVAKERHVKAVQQALQNYNTASTADTTADTTASTDGAQETETVHPHCLREYTIDAPGALPDFGTELARTVFCTDPEPLLTRQECAQVIQDADDYFAQAPHNGQWTTQQSGQYQMAGFYIRDIPSIHAWFVDTVQHRLFPLLKKTYPHFIHSPDDLCVDNAYLFKYTAETGRRTDVHTDSGCLSFTICLNPATDYQGGGTWFEGLQDSERGIVEMDVGQVTIRPGGVKHCGHAVDSGVRYIIGGFCMHRNKVETVRQLLTSDSTTSAADQRANLEAAVVLNPQSDAGYNLLANSYEQAGDKVAAQKVLEYCLQHVHPVSGEVAYSLGSLYLEQEQYGKVVECMETCLRADDCDVDAMMTLAHAHAGLGDATGEEECYQRIIRTASGSNKVIAAAYCNLGVLNQGKTDEEIQYYTKALEYVPENFEARYSLAGAFANSGQWTEAVATFKEAIDQARDNEGYAVKALKALYKASLELIRTSSAPPPASQEEMMQRFQNVMGSENYERLAANAAARAS
jgi:tetratricopeptide (TPR) repeat protein